MYRIFSLNMWDKHTVDHLLISDIGAQHRKFGINMVEFLTAEI